MEKIINTIYSFMHKRVDRKYLRILAFLAFSWSLYKGWRFASFIEGKFLRGSRNFRVRYGEGTFAIITDPTTAVGRCFCLELTRRSFNLILLGTHEGRLLSIVEECKKLNPKLEAKVLLFDVEKANDETYYDLLYSNIKHLNTSLLIANNTSHFQGSFLQMAPQDMFSVLLKDCYSTLFLYRKVIPSMLGRATPGGIIIVTGHRSPAAVPSIVSGARMFRYFLSRSIGIEYSNKLDILVVNPFEVEGEEKQKEELDLSTPEGDVTMMFQDPQKTEDETKKEKKWNISNWRKVSAESFVKACFQKLSFEKETRGHWKHEIAGAFC